MDTKKVTIIDFHAHILPGLDHGCDSVRMAQRQLILAAEAGVDKVVATSHFYPHLDTVVSFLASRKRAYDEIKQMIPASLNTPEILLGAEILVCEGMERMEGLGQLCIEGSRALLLEMPFSDRWDASLFTSVRRISKEYQLILAHADRYPLEKVKELVDTGCLLQINADALCTLSKRRKSRRLMETGAVVAIGSDIHGTKKGYCNFCRAQRVLKDASTEIMKRTEAVLAGKEERK